MTFNSVVLDEESNLAIQYTGEPHSKTLVLCPGFGTTGRGARIVTETMRKYLPYNTSTFSFPSHSGTHLDNFANDHQVIPRVLSKLSESGYDDTVLVGISYGAFVLLDHLSKTSDTADGTSKTILLGPFFGPNSFSKSFSYVAKCAKKIAQVRNMEENNLIGDSAPVQRTVNYCALFDYLSDTPPIPAKGNFLGVHVDGGTFMHAFFSRSNLEGLMGEMGGDLIDVKTKGTELNGDLTHFYSQLDYFLRK